MAYTTINKSTDYFNTKLYTGNGGTQSITGVGFQSDWSWFKKRNGAADSSIMDAVRGVRKSLTSNNNEAEYTETSGLSSWDSDGFSFDGAGFDYVNTNGDTFASWNWKANGAGSANTDGSISSTVSVNTTSGFSIVKYVGTGSGSNSTVGHGLGVTPSMILVKNLDSVTDWVVWHKDLPSQTNNYLRLNTNQAIGTTTNYWNSVAPTNQVFGVSPDGYNNNKSGEDTIAYCFADVQGYSKFGSYTGNGNADGSFIYTGFSPAFVMIKETTGTGKWVMKDNRRTGINVNQSTIYANEPEAEGTPGYELIDLLSNGFKQRGTGSYVNGSGTPYIFMAFAEHPLVGTNNVPCTAR